MVSNTGRLTELTLIGVISDPITPREDEIVSLDTQIIRKICLILGIFLA